VMVGAIITTKIPILLGTELFGLTLRELPRYGLLMMLHEARTDLAMLASLLLLYRYGSGVTELRAQ
jgi:putative oxidoreductase